MTEAVVQAIAKGTAKENTDSEIQANTDLEILLQLCLFSGLGLLISVGVIVLDKYTPGEWF
jgi:hypothetical protein